MILQWITSFEHNWIFEYWVTIASMSKTFVLLILLLKATRHKLVQPQLHFLMLTFLTLFEVFLVSSNSRDGYLNLEHILVDLSICFSARKLESLICATRTKKKKQEERRVEEHVHYRKVTTIFWTVLSFCRFHLNATRLNLSSSNSDLLQSNLASICRYLFSFIVYFLK